MWSVKRRKNVKWRSDRRREMSRSSIVLVSICLDVGGWRIIVMLILLRRLQRRAVLLTYLSNICFPCRRSSRSKAYAVLIGWDKDWESLRWTSSDRVRCVLE